jgi:hypothetical protein
MNRGATIPETIPKSGANLGRTGRRSGSFLGFPLEGFGFFTSLLLALSSGFFTFFLVTALSIFGLLVWNQMLHHRVNYADSYLFFGFPAAVVVWAVALGVFGTLWIRAKIHAR